MKLIFLLFDDKYGPDVNIRISMSDYREENWLLNISLYSIGNAKKIIK